jgi:hypothetical protein
MHEGEIAQLKDIEKVFKVGQQKALDMRMKARRFFLKEENADVTISQVRVANGLDARLNSLSIIEKQKLIEVICTEVIKEYSELGTINNLNLTSLKIQSIIEVVCEKYNFNQYLIYRIMRGL